MYHTQSHTHTAALLSEASEEENEITNLGV